MNKGHKDSINIEGDKDKIEVSNVEDIEVKGKDNIIKVEGEDKDIKIKGDDNVIDIKEKAEREEEKKQEPRETFAERAISEEKGLKKNSKKLLNFLTQKKTIIGILIVLLLMLVYVSASIRVSNLPLLEDSTTGKKIPLALDPYYFLRIAETKIANDGVLPETDNMRAAPLFHKPFSNEIHSHIVVWMYKATSAFNPDTSIQYINIISPVIFFIIGLIAFFFLIYFLTHSKTTAFLSATALAFIPGFLYRTMAGFSDHESPGITAFFILLIGFILAMNFLSENLKNSKRDYYKIVLWTLLIGFLTAITIASWGGIANYAFMIIPLSFLIFWVVKNQDIEKRNTITKFKYALFYGLWVVFSVVLTKIFGYNLKNILNSYILSGTGAPTLFVLVFLVIDFFVIWAYQNKKQVLPKFLRKNEKSRVFFSLALTFLLGLIGLLVLKGDVINYLKVIFEKFTRPMGTDRVGVTVAENRAPYLTEWFSNAGKVFFWMFFLGMSFFGIKMSNKIRKRKHKWMFVLGWIVLLSGVLFSRVSSGHILNGDNFISHFIYIGSILIFAGIISIIYFKSEINIDHRQATIASWLLLTLVSGRGSIRMFFIIMPFICFMSSYFVVTTFKYANENKEEISNLILWILFLFALVGYVFSIGTYYTSVQIQAKNTSPSANEQWQKAMSWVRENTQERDVFTHWWDYGYWVQYLGERPSVTDGGHPVGYWNHLIGRYLLTTPNPDSAMSFMKTHNVSYLLIDPTDLGKYGAYSSIGSGEGSERKDRLDYLPVMGQDSSQTRDTANGTQYVYPGGAVLNEDIYYEKNSTEVFLPAEKAGLGAVILQILNAKSNSSNSLSFSAPQGVFVYNNQQYILPIRYLYFEGKLYDFKQGIDSTIRVVPSLNTQNQGYQYSLNKFGSIVYLSPKVSESLFAQLYLMNDPLDKYPTLKIAHKEEDPLIENLKLNGADINDFVVYRGFRGPIKIWDVEYPEETLIKEEFLETSVPEEGYGSLDNLQFVK